MYVCEQKQQDVSALVDALVRQCVDEEKKIFAGAFFHTYMHTHTHTCIRTTYITLMKGSKINGTCCKIFCT